jgi:DHA2 family multidrug resistance protein
MGYTATLAGLALAPVGLLAILLTPVVGRNLHRIDPRRLVTVAFLIFALALWMRSRFNTDATMYVVLIPTIVQGAAMAFFFVPLVSLGLSGLPPERIPAASGLFNFARITAGAFGTSIVTTLWDHRATVHHAQLVDRLTPDNPTVAQALAGLGSRGAELSQGLAVLNRSVDQQAFMSAANDVFLVSAALFLVLIAVIWLARPPRAAAGTAAAASGAH